jgi:hypothetical protein
MFIWRTIVFITIFFIWIINTIWNTI